MSQPNSADTQDNFDVEAAIKQYPGLERFRNNIKALKAVYTTLNPKKDLKGLVERANVEEIEVIVAQVFGEWPYNGCPKCFHKIDADAGVQMACTSKKCNGETTIVTKLPKWRLLAGDVNDIVFIDFVPFAYKLDTNAGDLVGKVVRISGYVGRPATTQKYGEVPVVIVKKMKILEDVKKIGKEALDVFPRKSVEEEKKEVEAKVAEEAKPETTPIVPPEKLTQIKIFFNVYNNAPLDNKFKNYMAQIGLSGKPTDDLIAAGIITPIDSTEGRRWKFNEPK